MVKLINGKTWADINNWSKFFFGLDPACSPILTLVRFVVEPLPKNAFRSIKIKEMSKTGFLNTLICPETKTRNQYQKQIPETNTGNQYQKPIPETNTKWIKSFFYLLYPILWIRSILLSSVNRYITLFSESTVKLSFFAFVAENTKLGKSEIVLVSFLLEVQDILT